MRNNKLVLTTESKTFHFDLPKHADNTFNHEIDFMIKHPELSAEHTIKN